MPLTVAQIINVAKISQFLAAQDAARGSLFGKRVSPQTARTLYLERKAVEWMYGIDPADTSLTLTSNYLYSLCRGYNLQAQNISGNGGSVSPVNNNTSSTPSPYEFIVSGSSFITTGTGTISIPTFANYNVLFVRNNIPQSTVDLGSGSYYSWDRNTKVFTCTPAASADELFQIYPV